MGSDRSADSGADRRGRLIRSSELLAQSDKSREREGRVLAVREEDYFPKIRRAVLVRQLRGPHLST